MEILEERATLVNQRRLYEVALSGNVSEFESLVENDPLILDRVLVPCSNETPLHMTAMRGHLDMTKELLKRCPNMAAELDSFRRCPLHLASARGYTDIVRELLQVNVGVCGSGDVDGRTPLHLAAMNGRVEVIRELVRCRPDSVVDLNEDEFLNQRDNRDNTILHLAAARKQLKTIEYLVQIEAVKGQANMKNRDGFTALDVLEHNPIVDANSIEVRRLLLQAGAAGGGGCTYESVKKCACGIWDKYFKIDDKWMEDARGNLIMAAALTATVAFQAGLTPPGSVWQSEEDYLNSTSILNITSPPPKGSGTAILATVWKDDFIEFMTFNTISFISSVCVIIMMISGFPLNNKFSILVLTLTMCTTLTFMVLTYLKSLWLLSPTNDTFDVALRMYKKTFITGIALFALVCVIHLTRVWVWTVRKGPQSCLVKPFIGCWKTDENEPHHHQTA